MKFTKLLVLSALCLFGLNATAEIVDGVRQKPVPSATYQAGETVYLFNVGAEMFFTAGNDWETRASVGEVGQKVVFTASDAALAQGEDVVELKSYVPKFSKMLSTFTDGVASIWTDNDNGANHFWKVTANGNYYRISNATFETSLFLGWDQSKNDTRLYLLAADTEGAFVDWQLYSEDDYNALNAYNVAQKLKALIDQAKTLNVDVTEAESLYLEETSTVEAMEAAAKTLTTAIADAAYNNATGENPADVTVKFIKNPSYADSKLDGWTSETSGGQSAPTVNSNGAEFYEKIFNHHQEISVIKAGVYAVGVQGYNRQMSTVDTYTMWKDGVESNTKFYVTVGDKSYEQSLMNIFEGSTNKKIGVGTEYGPNGKADDGQSNYVPNNMDAGAAYFAAGRYKNSMFVDVNENGKFVIGLKNAVKTGMDWTMFKNWTLTYYGSGADAYLAWAKSAAAQTPLFEGAVATQTIVNGYLAVRNAPAAANEAEVQAYIEQLTAAKEAVQKNISLWVQYEEKVVEAQKLANQLKEEGKTNSQEYEDLNDYATGSFPAGEYGDEFAPNGSASYILNARAMDNEQLEAEIAYVDELIQAVKFLTPNEGEDVTRYLTNADFSKNKEGWTGWGKSSNSNMPTTGGSPNICAESYNANNFDLYQEVKGNVPVGVYEISVQGFTRIGRNDDATKGIAWQQFRETEGKQKMPVYVYFNDNATNMKDVHEEPQLRDFYTDTTVGNLFENGAHIAQHLDSLSNSGYYSKFEPETPLFFPNSMDGASYAFTKGMYVNSAYGAVVNLGDSIRIGVKGSTNGANWSIYDNFKLTFWGTKADKVLLALKEGIKDVEALNAGTIGKNVVQRIANALSAAKQAADEQSTDGEAMFATLGELYAAKNAVQASQELMNKLAAANDSLQDAVSAANMSNLLKNANAFRQDNGTRLNNNDINDDEVPELLNQIRQWMKDIKKFVELQEWADKLNDAQPTDKELEDGLVTYSWLSEWESFAATLEVMLNPESDDEAVKAEEVDGLIEQIKIMLDKKYIPANIDTASDTNPVNLTKMLKSPNFSKTETGKEADQIEGWTVTSNYEGLDAEVFGYYVDKSKNFDVYQDIHGLPEGIYEVRNQAFYRFGYTEEDYALYKRFQEEQKDSSNVFLYAENQTKTDTIRSSVRVKLMASGARENMLVKESTTNIEGEGSVVTRDTIGSQVPLRVALDTLESVSGKKDSVKYDTIAYVPNNVVAANGYMNEEGTERWLNKVVVKLSKDGVLRLGMKKQASVAGDWVIMDNFQLFYYGKDSQQIPYDDPSGIVATEQKARVLRTEYFTIGGMRTLAPQQGIAIMRQTLENGNVVVKKVNLK
jgi:hypothetical protein